MEAILLILLTILLLGWLGNDVIVKDENGKEININEKINKFIDKIKSKL